jgi:enterobactin synthetase component D
MQNVFNIHDVAFFQTSLPIDAQVERDFSYCLPSKLEKASALRKQEYIAGRYCAFKAAKQLSAEIHNIENASTREPIWPLGLAGSISHSKNMAISCVAKSENYLSLGIDAEDFIRPQGAQDIIGTVASLEEASYINGLNDQAALTILFSAKEALYKALFPISRCFIDFKEVRLVSLDLEKKSFELELISEQKELAKFLGSYTGSFRIENQTVVTLITISKDKYAYS